MLETSRWTNNEGNEKNNDWSKIQTLDLKDLKNRLDLCDMIKHD